MKTLLQIEWMKVKGYRTFWVLVALFVVALIGINYISFRINYEINQAVPVGAFLGNPYEFPRIWETVSWISSFMLYFPGFIMILLISNEYTYKTHRQNIIDGLSRSQFILSKLYIAFLLTVFSTLLVFTSTVIFGIASGQGFSFNGISGAGYYFVCSWVYLLFAMLLAILLRRAVLAIGILFIYGLIIDNVLPFWLGFNYLDRKPYITYFLPLDVADGLLRHPFRTQSERVLTPPNTSICLAISIGWIVFYHWFTNRNFQKKDL